MHHGFKVALDCVWDRIKARLLSLPQPVFFTEHSLGGALATLAAARALQTTSLNSPAAVYTFGSPRVGDEAFGHAFAELFHCRVVNENDLVPTNYVRRLEEVAHHPDEASRGGSFSPTTHNNNTPMAMIVDLLKKDELREHVEAWQRLVTRARNGLQTGNDPAVTAAAQKHGWKVGELDALDAFLKRAAAGFGHEADAVYIAPEEELSILQTIMEGAYTRAGLVEASSGQGLAGGLPAVSSHTLKPEIQPSDGQSLFYTDFDEPNPLFITEGIKAVAYRLLHGRHEFSDRPPTVALSRKARLILVGDWGSGIERAERIAGQMAAQVVPDRECHMIHLGDIYFCGWPDEARERFLDRWPVKTGPSGVSSWCLNGNHDMYCGGQGYFQVVLGDPRFAKQGGCSYFALENEHWQILGLDTAYKEWELHGNQLDWAVQKRTASPAKKGILLSHHQPFSDYEKDDTGKKSGRLLSIVAPLLQGQTTAWLWGHEHRAIVYGPHDRTFSGGKGHLPFGACLGNGGVPTRPTRLANPATSLHAETGHFRVGLEKFGLFGFAVLDLDGDRGALTVYNELGAAAGPFPIP